MSTASYTVAGMTCGHCVQAVTDEVTGIDGVTDVSVILEGGELTVTSEQEIPLATIAEAVYEAGDYTVVPR